MALPDHADRVLAGPAWVALTTTLARAETAGHNLRHLLSEVGARPESSTLPSVLPKCSTGASPLSRTDAVSST